MRRALIVLAMAAPSASAQSIDRILAAAAERRAADPCAAKAPDEIVVCARDDRRYRMPYDTPRDPQAVGAVAGEVPRATTADPYATGCGIHQGQGRCTRREMEAYGYGRGRDPLTLVGRLARKAVDPDAEVGPPPPDLPRPRN